jgi:glucose-6-phosphate isomerase
MNKVLNFSGLERKPDIRRARDMKEVILDKEWLKGNEDVELYYMYRDLWKWGDEKKIFQNNLRYDITIIPPRTLGRELVKTMGHYHPECSPGVTYPEIYEVQEGRAHFLLQKKSGTEITDVILIEAGAGEKAIMPPNYGHITINPGKETLKMANWVNRKFKSIYGDIVERGGGAYFELVGGELVKNPNYGEVPEIRRVRPTVIPAFGIEAGRSMYALIREPEKLHFLENPKEYDWAFKLGLGFK